MKRLIVCLDGTWNTPDQGCEPTNVVKMMRAIRPYDDTRADEGAGVAQVTFYDKGVGTGGPIDRVRGGALGRGLDDNVQDGYRFLANNYDETAKDEIYIFGFSRGAFTARSLAGFIGACGLLKKNEMDRLPQAWSLYRTPPDERSRADKDALRAQARFPVPIRCVGVWDTVGALGIPLRVAAKWNAKHYRFHDTTLGRRIDCAFHAVAIDEKRGPFAPTLWQTPRPPRDPADGEQVIEQVWFAGVHSNVGGSYPDPGLSDIALDWMIGRVRANTALAFDADYLNDHLDGNHMGEHYDSRSFYVGTRLVPFFRVIGGHRGDASWLRDMLNRTLEPALGQSFINEMIHRSALDRLNRQAPYDGRQEVYAPKNLLAAAGKLPVVEYDGSITRI